MTAQQTVNAQEAQRDMKLERNDLRETRQEREVPLALWRQMRQQVADRIPGPMARYV
jgi:hypothetical protein